MDLGIAPGCLQTGEKSNETQVVAFAGWNSRFGWGSNLRALRPGQQLI
jgi:hypothetical protein